MKLVIAEKPSVAISIAKVIGATSKKDKYDEKYAKWNLSDLPIIPSEYKYEVSKSTKKQFNMLKKSMNEKDIDTIINACDTGREGESVFRLVYQMTGSKKNMQRLWISLMEDNAIRDGFNHLKDGCYYDNLFESANARAIADTRLKNFLMKLAVTLKLKKLLKGKRKLVLSYLLI